jgi:hypothetical protein
MHMKVFFMYNFRVNENIYRRCLDENKIIIIMTAVYFLLTSFQSQVNIEICC